jgi:hypothetical protein
MKRIVTSIAVAAVIFGIYLYFAKPLAKHNLTEFWAREIAEQSCIKGGEALGEGVYNVMTKTWWYDANLNATRPGCRPACVVSEETGTAEINWRCTGLIAPTNIE